MEFGVWGSGFWMYLSFGLRGWGTVGCELVLRQWTLAGLTNLAVLVRRGFMGSGYMGRGFRGDGLIRSRKSEVC